MLPPERVKSEAGPTANHAGLQQPPFRGPHHRLDTAVGVQLLVQPLDVGLDRVLAQADPLPNLAIGEPLRDQAQNLNLPQRQVVRGIGLWSILGDRFNVRAGLAALGFGSAGVLLYVALSAQQMALVLACFSLGVFMISAFNACEFAMIQGISPLEKTAPAMGVYHGMTTMIGGGLGPFIVSPIIGEGGPFWLLSVIALFNAALLLLAWRLIRY